MIKPRTLWTGKETQRDPEGKMYLGISTAAVVDRLDGDTVIYRKQRANLDGFNPLPCRLPVSDFLKQFTFNRSL